MTTIISRLLIVVLLGSIACSGCVTHSSSPEKISARTWNFSIEGQLGSISVSDLAAVVKVMGATKIYRIRIINHNRVEVDTNPGWIMYGDSVNGHHRLRRILTDPSTSYTVVKRVHGFWESTEHVATVY